jgi:predicted nucleotidyltransferase
LRFAGKNFWEGRAMEAKLAEFVKRLKDGGRGNLKAVVLYGSAVTGEFREGASDLNIL